MSATFSQRLMSDILWAFRKSYTDQPQFEAAVAQYHLDIVDSDARWQPKAVILPACKVRIQFEYWVLEPEEREVEATVELQTANPEGFTAGDLLFQIQRATAAHLAPMDHKFFEGLVLNSTDAEGVPLYDMRLGS